MGTVTDVPEAVSAQKSRGTPQGVKIFFNSRVQDSPYKEHARMALRILILYGFMLIGPLVASQPTQVHQPQKRLYARVRVVSPPDAHPGPQRVTPQEWEDGAQHLAWFRGEANLNPDAVHAFIESLQQETTEVQMKKL